MSITSIFITGALALFFSLSFHSCGSKETSNDATITFWHFWSEPSQKAVLLQLIKEFEQKYHCTVQCTELSWNDGKTKLMAAFNTSTAPDVMEFGSDWVAQFSSSGVLAELQADSLKMDRFIHWSTAPCRWQQKLYAVPWVVDTRVMYVNKTLLEQAGYNALPKTWDEVRMMAEKIQSQGAAGFGTNGADAHRLYKKILPVFWSFGGDIFDAEGNCIVNSANNVAALNLYLELSRSGIIDTQKQLDAAFAQGTLAFWNSGGWLADKIGKENPLLDYAVIPLPDSPTGQGISFAGGEYLAVNAASKQQQRARDLIAFLSEGSNALSFCKQVTEAGFPADSSHFSDNYFDSHPIRRVFAQQLRSARMTPVHSHWLEIEDIIENAVVEALYGRKEAGQALNDARTAITTLSRSRVSK